MSGRPRSVGRRRHSCRPQRRTYLDGLGRDRADSRTTAASTPAPTQPAVDVRPCRRGRLQPADARGPASASRACHGAVERVARDPQHHRRAPAATVADRVWREHVAEAAQEDLRRRRRGDLQPARRHGQLERARRRLRLRAQAGAARRRRGGRRPSRAPAAGPSGSPGGGRERDPVGARQRPVGGRAAAPEQPRQLRRRGRGRAEVLDRGEIRARRRSAARRVGCGPELRRHAARRRELDARRARRRARRPGRAGSRRRCAARRGWRPWRTRAARAAPRARPRVMRTPRAASTAISSRKSAPG